MKSNEIFRLQKLMTVFPEEFYAVRMLLENLVHSNRVKLLYMSSVKMALSHQIINQYLMGVWGKGRGRRYDILLFS